MATPRSAASGRALLRALGLPPARLVVVVAILHPIEASGAGLLMTDLEMTARGRPEKASIGPLAGDRT
jgi:hypothetical protein